MIDSIQFVRIVGTISSQLSRMVKMEQRSAINKNPSKQKSERCLSREGEENVCEKEIHFG